MQIGVDIGGTFTDVLVSRDGSLHVIKEPSTPDRPEEGVENGLAEIPESLDAPLSEVEFISHGTTVATNAVLEGSWSDAALVTTAGFRDVLEIGRQDRPDLYDLQVEKSPPIVPRDRRFEVAERIGEDGSVLVPFDEQEARAVAEEIDALDVSAVAVCFLHAFRDPSHEQRMGDVLQDVCSDVTVTLSTQVLPEIREYERTTTTAMSATLEPVMGNYLDRLRSSLDELQVPAALNVMQSNGGIITAETAREKAVNTLLSGPAAGVRGATYISQATGFDDVITMDMGGTSCDVSIVRDGEAIRSTELKVGSYPVPIPMIDIHTIGNGGGSKAWLDAGGALRVGPQSAGADPGPICYGRGGEAVTVTDAHVLLGRVDPSAFIGSDLGVSAERLRTAFESELAEPLGRTPEQIAQDVLDVANANMLRALKVISTERGHDPREFSLVAFGGAGPLHATALANELEVERVIVPRHAGVLSALGLLASDTVYDFVQSELRPWDEVDPEAIEAAFNELEQRGDEQLAAADVPPPVRSFERAIDVRYRGQSFELTVPISGELSAAVLAEVAERFHDRHRSRYGHASPDEPLELVNLRVDAIGAVDPPDLEAIELPTTPMDGAIHTTRSVYFAGDQIECPVYDWNRLPRGSFEGPAIVEGDESTTTVFPNQRAEVDQYGNLLIQQAGDRR